MLRRTRQRKTPEGMQGLWSRDTSATMRREFSTLIALSPMCRPHTAGSTADNYGYIDVTQRRYWYAMQETNYA